MSCRPDAPSPSKDQAGFEDVALDMKTIETYANQIRSKHALFVFDSCFSGSVFYVTRGVPPVISYKASEPVRQLITSNSETENVPDVSIFREQFVAALNGRRERFERRRLFDRRRVGVLSRRKGDQLFRRHAARNTVNSAIRNWTKGMSCLRCRRPPRRQTTPTPPPTDFSLDDVMPEAWQDYADKMAAAFAQVRDYDAQPRRAAARKRRPGRSS